jgi:hypothetical protein
MSLVSPPGKMALTSPPEKGVSEGYGIEDVVYEGGRDAIIVAAVASPTTHDGCLDDERAERESLFPAGE